MAIEILKRERAVLRERARWYNRRHVHDGRVSVRTQNTLRMCAGLTMAILALKNSGLA